MPRDARLPPATRTPVVYVTCPPPKGGGCGSYSRLRRHGMPHVSVVELSEWSTKTPTYPRRIMNSATAVAAAIETPIIHTTFGPACCRTRENTLWTGKSTTRTSRIKTAKNTACESGPRRRRKTPARADNAAISRYDSATKNLSSHRCSPASNEILGFVASSLIVDAGEKDIAKP